MSFTWSTADLGVLVPGDSPVQLGYGDSFSAPKAPSASDKAYTTVIALHGLGFNSQIWSPILPYLPEDIRLIAVNRRGFSGSGPVYPSAHYGTLPSEKDIEVTSTEAFGRYVVDILAFIEYVVEELKVPAQDKHTGKGGIVLLGWSKGCTFVMSLLGLISSDALPDSHRIPPSVLAPYLPILRQHIKSFVMFEPTAIIMGNSIGRTIVDSSIPPTQLAEGIVGSFVGSVPSENAHLLQRAVGDYETTAQDFYEWNGIDDAERASSAQRAMDGLPSHVGVGLIYCEATPVETCIYGARWLTERFEGRRNTAIEVIPGGDHFAMATYPEVFAEAVVSCVHNLDEKVLAAVGAVKD